MVGLTPHPSKFLKIEDYYVTPFGIIKITEKMKKPEIQIHDAKASKKNPNAKYQVRSVGKNGEPLQSSEALNDVKAVKTHVNAMKKCWFTDSFIAMGIITYDYTRDQKFAKSGFATPCKTDKLKIKEVKK